MVNISCTPEYKGNLHFASEKHRKVNKKVNFVLDRARMPRGGVDV
jgi:hypothetical protein